MIKWLLAPLGLFLCLSVEAATRYVSNTSTNGFTSGADSGTATTVGAPWLTVSYAVANASSGDTIVINDGTYTHTGSLTPAATNLTLSPYTSRGVTLTSSSGTNSVLLVNLAGSGLTVGALILDGTSTKTAVVTFDTANNVTATFNGTLFKGSTTHGMTSMGRVTGLTLANGWEIQLSGTSGTTQSAINGVPTQAASVWSITGGTITLTCSSTPSTACQGVLISPTASLTATVSENRIDMYGTAGTGNVRGIYTEGVTTATIESNVISYSGVTTKTVYGIMTPNDAIDASRVSINSNTVTADAIGENTNIGYMVGNNDVPATSNNVTVSSFDGNYTKNFNHCAMFGYVSGAVGSRHQCVNGLVGILCKTTVNGCRWTGSTIIGGPFSGGAIRLRGDTNGISSNNSVYLSGSSLTTSSIGILVDDSPEASNSGTVIENNAIAAEIAVTNLVDVDTGDAATFRYNGYSANAAWNYQGTPYATRAAWLAVESTALQDTSGNMGWRKAAPQNAEDMRISSSSFLRRVGYDLNIGRILDVGGRAFHHPPSIGAWESASGDIATERTAR